MSLKNLDQEHMEERSWEVTGSQPLQEMSPNFPTGGVTSGRMENNALLKVLYTKYVK
jgi:hypothetical protein